ncbi:MAG: HlyD family secretion protein [Gemmataceae bacterium]|nr:HlyD family secretion protein [Gemmataceae bacterium]
MPANPKENPGPAPKPKPIAWWFLPWFLLFLVAGGLLGWWWVRLSSVSTENAYVIGNVTPISSEVSGPVVAMYVDDNMEVKPGDPLIQIDPIPFQLEVEQALSDYKQAKAEAEAARLNIRLTREDRLALLEGAKAREKDQEHGVDAAEFEVKTRDQIHQKEKDTLASAKAQLPGLEALRVNAWEYLDRFTRLANSGDIPVQEMDNKNAIYREASAKVEALARQIASLEKQVLASGFQFQQSREIALQARRKLDDTKAEVAKAQAAQIQPDIAVAVSKSLDSKVEQGIAKLALARLKLSNTLVRAPQGGIISKRTVQLGLTVTARQTFLSITPLDLGNVWVVANLREDQLAQTRVGQTVHVSIDAIPDRTFPCWVESLSGGTGSAFSLFPPDNATGNFTRIVQRLPIRLRFLEKENPEGRIRPGMSCKVHLDSQASPLPTQKNW